MAMAVKGCIWHAAGESWSSLGPDRAVLPARGFLSNQCIYDRLIPKLREGLFIPLLYTAVSNLHV